MLRVPDRKRGTYLTLLCILISNPPSHCTPPVLHQKGLSVFLTLSIAKSSLCLRPRYQMITDKINFQELPDFTADLSFGTPGSTIFLLANPIKKRKEKLLSYFTLLIIRILFSFNKVSIVFIFEKNWQCHLFIIPSDRLVMIYH